MISLTELHPQCTLINPNDTIPVYPFDFGKDPFSDSCSNIITLCDLEENILDKTLWTYLNKDDVLFKITSEPFSLRDSKENYFDESMVFI